jgi:hypothetical protein
MAITNSVHTLSTPRKLIANGRDLSASDHGFVTVSAASAAILIGGDNLTVANGFPVAATTGIATFELGPGDNLFAIATTGTPTVSVMTSSSAYVAP